METPDRFMNTKKSETEAATDTGIVTQEATRVTRRRRRLTLDDARAVAALCAKRASEREACAHLGIPYSTWAHYKSKNRNGEAFLEIVDAIKGAKIEAHLSNIESFSTKDWRASECYLEKCMPDRYSNKASVGNDAPPLQIISDSALKAILDKVFDQPRAEQGIAVESATEPKQIAN